MFRRLIVVAPILLSACGVLSACGDDSVIVFPPYEDGAVVVTDKDGTTKGTPTGEGCVETSAGCVPVSECNGPSDVIVDSEGSMAVGVCYGEPDAKPTTVSSTASTSVSDSSSVVTFDPALNGTPIDDLSLSGSKSVIYGNGPENTILAGTLDVSGSSPRVRGVRVRGATTISGSNGTVALSVLEGNVSITGSGSLIADTYILGDLSISGSNTRLVRVGIGGTLTLEGSGSICDDVFKWNDANGDKTFQPSEKGEALDCL